MRLLAFLLLLAFAVPAHAEAVPGTAVTIVPPPGFEPSTRFPGFLHEATGASIVVTEVPAPFATVARGFTNEQGLAAQGMMLTAQSEVTVDGRPARLLSFDQVVNGARFVKWVLAVDRGAVTNLLVGSYPAAIAAQSEAPVKDALLAARFGKPLDPVEALSFTIVAAAPFEVARVAGQTVLLSPGGKFPLEDERAPIMVAGLSASKDLDVPDKKAFAERRIEQTATVTDVVRGETRPVTIAGLDGFEVFAEGRGKTAGVKLTIYQVILYDSAGYAVMQAVMPTAEKETYLPIFARIAGSFAMKAPRR
ncbi:MAG: hypothetical protein AB7K86_02720 [Rhodospirillales bacterium]